MSAWLKVEVPSDAAAPQWLSSDAIHVLSAISSSHDGRSKDDAKQPIVPIESIPSRSKIYRSCAEARAGGFSKSGTYSVSAGGGTPNDVYCDMEIVGGGWTLITHTKSAGNWPNQDTFLSGYSSGTSGSSFTGYGTYDPSWTDQNSDYSRSLLDVGAHEEVLFMTGGRSKWCILSFNDLVRNSNNDDERRTRVLQGYGTNVRRNGRTNVKGSQPSHPWIGCEGTFVDNGNKMFMGERNSGSKTEMKTSNNGIGIFVRPASGSSFSSTCTEMARDTHRSDNTNPAQEGDRPRSLEYHHAWLDASVATPASNNVHAATNDVHYVNVVCDTRNDEMTGSGYRQRLDLVGIMKTSNTYATPRSPRIGTMHLPLPKHVADARKDVCEARGMQPFTTRTIRDLYYVSPPLINTYSAAYMKSKNIMQRCQGDCDNDNDCAGALKCSSTYYNVPGCYDKSNSLGKSGWNYCYDPASNGAGYVTKSTGHCSSRITSYTECDNARINLGLQGTSQGSWSYLPYGCSMWGSSIHYNTHGHDRDCSYSSSKYCICHNMDNNEGGTIKASPYITSSGNHDNLNNPTFKINNDDIVCVEKEDKLHPKEQMQCIAGSYLDSTTSGTTISCPRGSIISGVDFASYGLPTGTCGNLKVNHACHDAKSEIYVQEKCVGKRTCTYSKRCRSNVAVIIVRIIFISPFLFYCLLLNHSFPTNPNSVTDCFKLILFLLQLNYIAQCVRYFDF